MALPQNVQTTTIHLATYLHNGGFTWKSYQEDIDTDSAGNVLPQSQWISPITNLSGHVHNRRQSVQRQQAIRLRREAQPADRSSPTPMAETTLTSNNPRRPIYAPLQQLQTDLNNNTVAITTGSRPTSSTIMHTRLTGGYKGLTGDNANIKQGDDFLAANRAHDHGVAGVQE